MTTDKYKKNLSPDAFCLSGTGCRWLRFLIALMPVFIALMFVVDTAHATIEQVAPISLPTIPSTGSWSGNTIPPSGNASLYDGYPTGDAACAAYPQNVDLYFYANNPISGTCRRNTQWGGIQVWAHLGYYQYWANFRMKCNFE